MSQRQQHKDYLKTKIHRIFEDVTAELVAQRPDNPARYLLQYLERISDTRINDTEKEELQRLRQEVNRLQSGQQQNDSYTESEDDEYDDEAQHIPHRKATVPRVAISAEAYGEWNKKEDFVPRTIQKTDEQKARIIDRLSRSFMFAALDANERDIIVNAMEERKFSTGETVIQQGEDGNELFVVDSGNLDCSKVFAQGQEAKYLKTYGPGEAFGELALLYNAPRAASIHAKTDSICWVLDRSCFNHIVKDAAMRRREQYEEFLSRVELLENMDPYERSQIADALKTANFSTGDYVIREGEWGDVFYFLIEGTAVATKTLTPGAPPKEVLNYGPGQYFGELALIRGEPRAANIVATSDLKCVTLDAAAFTRMLGPLEDILRRNFEKYEGLIAN